VSESRGRPPLFGDSGDLGRIGDLVTTGGYQLGALAARVMPSVVAAGLVAPFGAGANLASPERREMVARHLRRVDPTLRGLRLRRAVQDAFDSYTRYWLESFRLPSLSKRAVAAAFEQDGYHYVLEALDEGNGVIIGLAHLGGWEWAGRWIADRGHPISVVVERIDPPELFEWFVELRSRLGMHVIPLGDGAASAVMRALRDNHVVCLLSDRDLSGDGPEVEFFGERTTLPAGPAALALRTGAPIIPTGVYFTNRLDGHLGYARQRIKVERSGARLREDVASVTQDLAHELEVLIRRAPTQWHLFQPNWPSDPGYHRGSTRVGHLPKE